MYFTKRVLYITILTINIVCSCRINTVKFPSSINVKSNEIQMEDFIFPRQLFIIDTLIIAQEDPRKKTIFSVINTNNSKLIATSGRLGRGPGEINNPAISTIDYSNRIIWCSDWGTYKIWKFPIDSMLSNPNFIPSYSVRIEKGLMPLLNLELYNNDFFMYAGFRDLISFIDHNGITIDSLGIKNTISDELAREKNIYDNFYIFKFNKDRKKIIIASRYTNSIICMDLKGNTLFKYTGNKIKQKTLKSDWDEVITYGLIDTDENFIYCLYQGKSKGYRKEGEVKYTPNYFENIHVFNWDGDPVCDLKLDHPLFRFALDRDKKQLIGIATDLGFSLVSIDIADLKYSDF